MRVNFRIARNPGAIINTARRHAPFTLRERCLANARVVGFRSDLCKSGAMVRRCAILAFVMAFIVTRGVAIMHAHTLRAPDSFSISTPCRPPSPGFRAEDGSEAVAMKDWTGPFENAEAPANLVRKSSVETFAWVMAIATTRAFPPLLDRPPPNS